MAKKLKNLIPIATVMIIIAAVFSWSFYQLIRQIISNMLLEMGITGDYWHNIIIIILMGTLLVIGGKRIGDVIK